jgi:hypothetical protein
VEIIDTGTDHFRTSLDPVRRTRAELENKLSPCSLEMMANSEMSKASGSRGPERENERENENETINDVRVSELCLLETGNPSGTFERGIPSGNPSGHFITRFINSIDTDRFNTIPDRVGPPGTEIAQEKVLAMNSATWPIGTAPSSLASTSGTYPAQTPSWTALFTHSMSVLSDLTAHVVPRGSPRGLEDTDYTDRG